MQGTYAVIGDPIDHSLSPTIHNAAFRELGMECAYIGYRILKGELRDGLDSLLAAHIIGFNVTIPHKIAIIDMLDDVDAQCKAAGACNTVKIHDGKLKGYNTDVQGFLDPLKRHGVNLYHAKSLVLGTGGAACAVVSGLAQNNANITIAGRSSSKISSVAKRTGVKINAIEFNDISKTSANFDIIINATSIGMKGESSMIPAESISSSTTVYDLVYRPVKTGLIKSAQKRGASVIYGHEMLLAQALMSFEIWHDTLPPYDVMKRALLGVHMT